MDIDLKNIKFPQYISGKDKTVTVCGCIEKDGKFTDGKGYIDDDGQIWIFVGSKPKITNVYPYFWFNDNNEIEYSKPNKKVLSDYNISNLKDLSLIKIIDNTVAGEVLLDDDALVQINSGTAFYTPTLKASDDFLKKMVKSVIIAKGIDINGLKSQTDQKYVLANMRSALENSTKMSVKYFLCWMELLDCDFQVVINNNDTTPSSPMNEVVFTSANDTVEVSKKNGKTETVVFE